MKNSLCVLCTFVSTTLATKVLAVPFSRVQNLEAPPRLVQRKTVQGNAVNAVQLITYYTNVTIGSPPQSVGLVIDTGSSDIWVPSTNSKETCDVSVQGCPFGTFDETRSSSFQNTGYPFSTEYGLVQKVSGTYMTDKLAINDMSIEDLNMALVTNASTPPARDLPFDEPTLGIMGLGFDAVQANYSHCLPTSATQDCMLGSSKCYKIQVPPCIRPGLLDRLVQQKAINSRAFSLYLNSLEAREGTILFGGIDAAKFTPPLLAIPILAQDVLYIIELTSVSIGVQGLHHPLTSFDIPQPLRVFLDSGSETMFLPPPLAAAIQADAGARIVKEFQYPIIDCSQSTNRTSLHFGFGGEGGPVIAVPKSELVIPRFDTKNVQLTYNGSAVCEFGVWISTSGASTKTYTMGDTFLRSAYVVYNMDNSSISLAQAIHNVLDTDIVEINATFTKRKDDNNNNTTPP